MRNSGNSRAFTLVELMAAICIVLVLVFALVTYIPQVIDWARQTSDRQTLTVLNDALSRYKTEGGDVGVLTPWIPISSVLSALKTAVTWGGYGHQFLHGGITYVGRSISATGTGSQYRFSRFNSFTAEPGISASDLGPAGGALVGWWKFDDGTGTVAADSAGGHTGTLGGTPGPAWTTGHSGTGLQFSGTSYVYGGNSFAFSGNAPYSICFWLYLTAALPASNWGRIASYETADANGREGWDIATIPNTTNFLFERYKNGTPVNAIITFSVGSWVHAVITYDGATIKTYKNGSLLSTNASASMDIPAIASNFYIGSGGGNYLQNTILDDVRIYNRALTAAEVAQIYSGH